VIIRGFFTTKYGLIQHCIKIDNAVYFTVLGTITLQTTVLYQFFFSSFNSWLNHTQPLHRRRTRHCVHCCTTASCQTQALSRLDKHWSRHCTSLLRQPRSTRMTLSTLRDPAACIFRTCNALRNYQQSPVFHTGVGEVVQLICWNNAWGRRIVHAHGRLLWAG
jgi:hypothetical protein